MKKVAALAGVVAVALVGTAQAAKKPPHHAVKPVHPHHAAKPSHPRKPSHPAKPHPAKPHPAKPHPAKPSHPAKPHPAKPSHPAEPSHPAKPRHPAAPKRPAQCKTHFVDYHASGTLVSVSGNQIQVMVKKANHHLPTGVETFTIATTTKEKVHGKSKTPAPGNKVKLRGKVAKNSGHCSTPGFAGFASTAVVLTKVDINTH